MSLQISICFPVLLFHYVFSFSPSQLLSFSYNSLFSLACLFVAFSQLILSTCAVLLPAPVPFDSFCLSSFSPSSRLFSYSSSVVSRHFVAKSHLSLPYFEHTANTIRSLCCSLVAPFVLVS